MEHIEKIEELISNLYGDFNDFKVQIKKLGSESERNAFHIEVLNKEGGEMKDEQKKMNVALEELKITSARTTTNLDWLLKFFWVIATASIGSLVASVLGLVLKK